MVARAGVGEEWEWGFFCVDEDVLESQRDAACALEGHLGVSVGYGSDS